ncbi:N-acetyltransferase family protein [Falsiroseomonas sp. HW251]|uniref:GNAT family N-acetyltransferase n=1 Tax=Falsiroseomonas sp. HW251 TaxID=3390998 RepID=UPI003D3175A6
MAADADALATLFRALNDEPWLSPQLITPEGITRDLIEDPRAIVLVAEHAGAPAGLATAHPAYDSGQSRWGLFLNDLFVAPDARRRGIGRALVAAVAAEAERTGCTFVWWNADEQDTLALRFHRSLHVEELRVSDFLLHGKAFDTLVRESLQQRARPSD